MVFINNSVTHPKKKKNKTNASATAVRLPTCARTEVSSEREPSRFGFATGLQWLDLSDVLADIFVHSRRLILGQVSIPIGPKIEF